MPVGQFVSFSIYANGSKLPEYQVSNKVYTEVNLLHGPNSYVIEEDEQNYPVLPFSISIERQCSDVVWIKILLDGQVICSRPLIRPSFCCDGVKVDTEIRELLFSLPRILEDQMSVTKKGKRNPLGEYAGTIRMMVTEAKYKGEQRSPVFQMRLAQHKNIEKSKLHHLTKKDVQHYQDASGCIVSREGRPTLNMMRTGHYRLLKKFAQTGTVLEELILYYRPHISSDPPSRPALQFIKEEEGGGAEEPQSRTPLCDIRNVLRQQNDENTLPESDTKMPQDGRSGVLQQSPVKDQNGNSQLSEFVAHTQVSQEAYNMEVQPSPVENGRAENQQSQSSGNAELMETNCADDKPSEKESQNHAGFMGNSCLHVTWCSSLIALKKIKHRDSCASAMLPPEQIKCRVSNDSALIPAEQIKRRESNDSALIPPEQIKHRESAVILPEQIKRRVSNDSALIPPEQIKHRESAVIPPEQIKRRVSNDMALIPPEQIKHRDSSASALIPPEQIERRVGNDSALIPPEQIKRRDSCASAVIPPEQIKRRDSCASAVIPPEQIKRRESLQPDAASGSKDGSSTEDFVLIDESDSEDDVICVYDVDDDNILYLGTEGEKMGTYDNFEGDSIVYMGDDDCHMMDVSDHDSIVEIDEISDTQ